MLSDVWEWLGRTNPDAWAAGAGWTTVVIALVASIAALRQVREARILREEQAQPYVVAYMEPSAAGQHLIELVVKNFGLTAARNVMIKCTPELRRSSSKEPDGEPVTLFSVLPILVPGQEWRTFWDSGLERQNTALPDKYDIEITYKDSRGQPMEPSPAILDWNIYKGRMWVETYGVHAAAKALREINKSVAKWSEFGGGLKVFARDGDAKDARKASAAAEYIARLKPQHDRASPTEPEGNEPESDSTNPKG